MRPQLLISGKFLIASAQSDVLPEGAIVVDGPRVVAVGRRGELEQQYPNATVWHRDDCAILPSFVNTHHHMYGVLAHGIPLHAAPTGFWAFLQDFWWPKVEDALTLEAIVAATDWACWEMSHNGITTFYDCLEAPNAIPGALEAEAEVVERWGLRGLLSFEATERQSAANGQAGLEENVKFVARQRARKSLVQGLMCFHTSFTCSRAFIERASELARELDVPVHMHVAEGSYEQEYCRAKYGKQVIEAYAEWGVLGPDVIASQCVQVSPREIELLAQHGAQISHMPLSNCEVGGGFSPVPEMLARGVVAGLGTDGYINDMFEVMRGAFLMPKARLQDPTVMPARTVWAMATVDGGRVLGLPEVGWLGPGSSADWMAVRLDLPTAPAAHNLLDQLLLWRSPGSILDVMAAGRWLKRDGEVLGGDAVTIRARCRQAAHKLWERARG